MPAQQHLPPHFKRIQKRYRRTVDMCRRYCTKTITSLICRYLQTHMSIITPHIFTPFTRIRVSIRFSTNLGDSRELFLVDATMFESFEYFRDLLDDLLIALLRVLRRSTSRKVEPRYGGGVAIAHIQTRQRYVGGPRRVRFVHFFRRFRASWRTRAEGGTWWRGRRCRSRTDNGRNDRRLERSRRDAMKDTVKVFAETFLRFVVG